MHKIIVAYDKNRAIGAKNDLPWGHSMKTDLRRVRELTSGNALIMGRKTFDSIGHALTNRQNIVITHRPFVSKDVTVVDSLDAAYAAVEAGKDAYVFGGGQIFKMALDSGSVDEVLATEIDVIADGADAYFPELGNEWHEVAREHHDASVVDAFAYDFVTLRRR